MPNRLLLATCLGIALAACSRAPQPGAEPTQAPAVSPPPSPATAAAAADPVAQVSASMDKFLAARSFHAQMTMSGEQNLTQELDFVAPDRYRIRMPIGTQVIIGDTLYLDMQGEKAKMPLPAGTLNQWRDPLKLQQGKAGLQVEPRGRDRIDGVAADKFLVRSPTEEGPVEFTYWIGSDGLPLQLQHGGQARGKPYRMTLRYSRFDDPGIAIEPPQ